MKVIKFGGSSVATAERIHDVMHIISDSFKQSSPLIVVVSAFGGVTDELIRLGQEAAKGKSEYHDDFAIFKSRHRSVCETLVDSNALPQTLEQLEKLFKELADALHGVSLVGEFSKRVGDLIMSFGERLSAYIISESLKSMLSSTQFVDSRELIITDRSFGAALVNYETSYDRIVKRFLNFKELAIVPGFIASSDQDETTTLGRGGSDFTVSILGAALKVEEIEIWTDVDGMMTCDPRKVQQAFAIPQMTYKEALEMSHFGAKVIYPPTIVPALKRNIPIRIKNTFNPKAAGTLITHQAQTLSSPICGISSIDNIVLIRVEGSGIVGVCGTAMRIFGALAKQEINVILITQGSSEHSICFAITPQHAEHAKQALESEFRLERSVGLIDPIVVEENLSVVAIVGENMRKIPGNAGKLFSALGKNGINVVAMVQGSSEYNISVVIHRKDETKALNVIHEEFFLSSTTTINMFLLGTGLIGKTLLRQIKRQLPILHKELALDLKLIGLANSHVMHFAPKGIPVQDWDQVLLTSNEKMHTSSFVSQMKNFNLMNSIFVDCTASQDIAETYSHILEANISIVTPNKKANSGPWEQFQTLKSLSKRKGIKFLYETNVGAGLPIISTVTDLLRSGDKILRIEAILSGTLSFLFNNFDAHKTFSQTLREAQNKGFTEPDPRDDLNGKDVARKLLILARETGCPFELDDITIETILPQSCLEANTIEEFYQNLALYDAQFEEKRLQAHQQQKVLRYIARFQNHDSKPRAGITLEMVDAQHPFFHLSGSDNIISFTTERYRDAPLVIKGQGAGAEVTAGEVFADIIRISAS